MQQQQSPAKWDTVIRPRNGWFDIDFKGLMKYRDLIMLMVKRNFTILYKQTILGPAWVVIQPLLTTLVFTVIFGKVAGLPTDGMPMFVFYMGGNVCWNYFSNCLINTSNTFIKNSDIFGKVYFPRLCMPFATIITELINFFVQFALFLIVVNANRPETRDLEGALEHLRAIERKTGRAIDGVINNCHLLLETDAACVAKGHALCRALCERTGKILWCDTYPAPIVPAEQVEGKYEHLLPVGMYMRPSWIDK